MKKFHPKDLIKQRIRQKRAEYERMRGFTAHEQEDYVGYSSRLINELTGYKAVPDYNKHGQHWVIKIPSVFSVITNPRDTLETILNLAEVARQAPIRSLSFDHSNLSEFDLSASTLLDMVATDIDRESTSRGKKINFSVLFPRKHRPNYDLSKRFLRSVGFSNKLNVSQKALSQGELDRLVLFEFENAGPTQTITYGASRHDEIAVKNFVDHINKCLSHIDLELTADGVADLSEYTGEVLDNIIEHSGDSRWKVRAYLDTNDANLTCEISILNLGITMGSSLERLPAESFTRRQIQGYLDKHLAGNVFLRRWDQLDLFTLLALQGQISSKNTDMTCDRGHGTVKLIQFFQDIANACLLGDDHAATKGQMSILSGATHIYFDGKYKMMLNSKGNMRIAFNRQNSMDHPPDSRYIKNIGYYFPGTIIGIRFPLISTRPSRQTGVLNV